MARVEITEVQVRLSETAFELQKISDPAQQGSYILKHLFALDSTPTEIHVRTDRHVRIETEHGLEIVESFGRLTAPQVCGILLALYRARTGAGADEATNDETLSTLLKEHGYLDFAAEGGNVLSDASTAIPACRVRVQGFVADTGIAATIRILRQIVPTLEDLRFDQETVDYLVKLVSKSSGLMLITGPTGSGKSTTLAALIGWVQRNLSRHILTIEQPIEYRHADVDQGGRPYPSLITQQEVGVHVKTFREGLYAALRKKPHIIMLGELRDAETMEICLEAAATGHLVIATTHTRSAPETITRVIDFFPAEIQGAILNRLATVVIGILAQGLLPSTGSIGRRVLCYELFQNNCTQTKAAIRQFTTNPNTLIEALRLDGNVSWTATLSALHGRGLVSKETVDQYQPEDLNK